LDPEGVEEDETFLISVAAGLLTVDIESGTIRLVHYIVEEYFQRNWQYWFPDAEERIAETCLMFEDFSVGYCSTGLRISPFLDYAARCWALHTRQCSSKCVEDLVLEFLHNEPKMFCAFQVIMPKDCRGRNMEILPQSIPSLWAAAFFGLEATVREEIGKGADVDEKISSGTTALHKAIERGFDTIARLLVDAKADLEVLNDRGWTGLHRAVYEGHEAITELLLEAGANPEVLTREREATPLLIAVCMRQEAVTKLLIKAGANVNAKDVGNSYGESALQWSAINADQRIARLLIEAGADINAKAGDGKTALHTAADHGQLAMDNWPWPISSYSKQGLISTSKRGPQGRQRCTTQPK
jgi:hypothetical protein